MEPISRRRLLHAMAAGGIAGAGLFAFGRFESQSLVVERRELRLPRWDADGFRVVVLADTHLDYPEAVERTKEAVSLAAREKPDLIVHLGDFITSAHPYHLQNIETAFEELREVDCPCVAVMGNHDYWAGYTDLVLSALAKSPFAIMRNEVREVDGVRILGLDDALVGRHRPRMAKGYDKNALVLLHEPDFVREIPPDPSLTLSGHSHGGQVCLPGGIRVKSPEGAIDYVRGFYPSAPVPLYVTRGVGTTGPRYRLFCPPELSVLTLRAS